MSAEEDYRRRMEQVQKELGLGGGDRQSDTSDPDRERRRRERAERHASRDDRPRDRDTVVSDAPSSRSRRSFEDDEESERPEYGERRPSVLDQPMTAEPAEIIDNSQTPNGKRENRVRIVDPPKEGDEGPQVKGILRRPTQKFPEDPNPVREGVAPLKDVSRGSVALPCRKT